MDKKHGLWKFKLQNASYISNNPFEVSVRVAGIPPRGGLTTNNRESKKETFVFELQQTRDARQQWIIEGITNYTDGDRVKIAA